MKGERKKRWCEDCASKKGFNCVQLAHKMCQDCKAKQASYGSAEDKKRLWCADCGKKHGGAVDLPALAKAQKNP
eukprot:COSAG04_NODE_4787_length_1894_cov_1.621170_2_plen_74_part_00